MQNKLEKMFSLDSMYISLAVFLIIYIFEEKNIIDVIYFFVVTFYYIKIKIYRWSKHH